MPQARRKTPFSGKAKKQQLQSKKQNKTLLMSTSSGTTSYDVVSVNYQPTRARGGRDTNRYALKFYRETEEELKIKKEEALKELIPVPEKELEVNPVDYFPADVSFPKRPPWDFNMSPAQLDAQEQRYFKNYIDGLQASEHWKNMSYFELNLETWRQLWRVLEMCDILLLIVDVRYAGMMFPPSLYTYIQEQKKDMILVLNKIDLVPSSVVCAWKQYLTTAYPALRVLYFTSCPAYNLRGATSDKAGLQVRRRKGKQRMCAEGATKILEACKEIVKGEVDLSSWEKKIKEETDVEFDYDEGAQIGETILEKADTSYYAHERYKSGVLSIGCVGQPNVGKSSLLNALMGRCVVSVSKTPGHTKHFQTIYLTPQVSRRYGRNQALWSVLGVVVGIRVGAPSYYSHERYKSGVLSIGCVGQPNVGKSSLLNALMGRCVVSVSKTPGHTKHFQTIYLTPQVSRIRVGAPSYYAHERYKSGVLSIGCVGQPNVGKSSLLNALMGRCVVSVSKTPGHTKHFQTIYLTPQVSRCYGRYYYSHERYKSGVLSIGCVGQPNVGKSSLLNALMGRCVVSVSKTPGHTKHFQTIYLTPQVSPN
uniref:Guanine nucleotide-binding protein-like 1 n=1 Tax=Spodoptera frugiperda TaxID=7108 RepID=A0A2H1V2N2_SPOFR